MKAHSTWTALPHGPIQKLTENLWRVEGTLPDMDLGRVMTLVKRADGSVLVHNAIALRPDAMDEVDAWGPVKWLVVPNGYHRLDARIYKDRYPAARVVCPAGAREKVEEVVPAGDTYDTFVPDEAVQLVHLEGVKKQEGVMTVRSRDGVTLVLNDAVFNLPHKRGVTGFIFRHIIQSTGGPRVSRVMRWLVVGDKAAFRAHLERLAETPHLRRLIVSHLDMVDVNPGGALRQAASTV
jgi:hypothetical protein